MPGHDLVTAKMLNETPRKKRHRSSHTNMQRNTKNQVFSYPMEICDSHTH